MRQTLFNSIIAILTTCAKLIGEDGTVRVYDYPITAPPGYPYAVVGSKSLESKTLDNARDLRTYCFNIQIIGEKFGGEGGSSQSDALLAMRDTEDQIMSAFDVKNGLGVGTVVKTEPTNSVYGYNNDNGARVVLSIDYRVDVTTNIIM